VPNFIKLSGAAVHELLCNRNREKRTDNAENNTAVASADNSDANELNVQE